MQKSIRIHGLKIHPEYYQEVLLGRKTFEIRKNDRNYQVGDMVRLCEYDPNKKEYTGRKLYKEITYITDYAQKENYVVFGLI